MCVFLTLDYLTQEDTLSSIHVPAKFMLFNWMFACKRRQRNPYLSLCTNVMSKWIKDLNLKPDTLNLIEQKVG